MSPQHIQKYARVRTKKHAFLPVIGQYMTLRRVVQHEIPLNPTLITAHSHPSLLQKPPLMHHHLVPMFLDVSVFWRHHLGLIRTHDPGHYGGLSGHHTCAWPYEDTILVHHLTARGNTICVINMIYVPHMISVISMINEVNMINIICTINARSVTHTITLTHTHTHTPKHTHRLTHTCTLPHAHRTSVNPLGASGLGTSPESVVIVTSGLPCVLPSLTLIQ